MTQGLPALQFNGAQANGSAQMNPGGLPAPLQGGLNWLNQNIVQPIAQSTQFKQMAASPVGQAVQGKFSNVAPALQEEWQGKLAGLPYKPQLAIGGEMEEVPGVNPQAMGTGTSFIRDAEGNLHVNPNPQRPIYSQDASAVDQYTAQPGTPKPPAKPEVPAKEPDVVQPYPYSKNPGAISKIGKGQNQAVRQIRLPASVGGAQEEDAINNTLDRLGFQGSGQEQYAQLKPKMQMLNDYVQKELNANPKTVPLDEVQKAFQDKLKNEFVAGGITKASAQQEANSYINRLYNAANPTEGDIVPSEIDTPTLYKMKVMANEQSRPLYKILNNGGALNDIQKVIMANRNALDDTIANYHPNVKQATMDMSNLYDAADSLENARLNPPPPFSLTQKVLGESGKFLPGQPIIDVAARTAGNIAKNPIARGTALVGLGAAGAYGLSQLNNEYNQGKQSNAQINGKEPGVGIHGGSIPQDPQTGHFQLPQNPSVTPLTPGTPEYTRADNAMTGGVRQFMQNAPQYMNTANTIQDDLKGGMPLDVLHAFKNIQDLQAYMSNPQNPYAKQLADIGRLNSQFMSAYASITGTKPDDSQMISAGDSAEQFQQKYQQMVQFIHDNYAQFQVPYLQTTETVQNPNATGTTGGQAPQYTGGLPQTPSSLPANMLQGGNIPALNIPPMGLPSIGQ